MTFAIQKWSHLAIAMTSAAAAGRPVHDPGHFGEAFCTKMSGIMKHRGAEPAGQRGPPERLGFLSAGDVIEEMRDARATEHALTQ
jgi:hypothetical protein